MTTRPNPVEATKRGVIVRIYLETTAPLSEIRALYKEGRFALVPTNVLVCLAEPEKKTRKRR